MKTRFGLVFDEREDGTKVWSAECQACGDVLVGERGVNVVVVSAKDHPMSPIYFDELRARLRAVWDEAKKSGRPILIGDPDLDVKTVPDHGSVQGALEAHAERCVRRGW